MKACDTRYTMAKGPFAVKAQRKVFDLKEGS